MTDDMLPVTQADRDAAADQYLAGLVSQFGTLPPWTSESECHIREGRADASVQVQAFAHYRHRLAAQSTAAVPEDWVLVPREAVEAQIVAVEAKAADTLWTGTPLLKGLTAYVRAMLAAAPPPPTATVSPDREREIVERCAQVAERRTDRSEAALVRLTAKQIAAAIRALSPPAGDSEVEKLREALELVLKYDEMLRTIQTPEDVLLEGDAPAIDKAYDRMVCRARAALRAGEGK